MKVEYGDIWKYRGKGHIVIPTNLGWRKDGSNVMGRGLAKMASLRYPELPVWYGTQCQKHREKTPCLVWAAPDASIILFPVKPLNAAAPWISWKSEADLDLIDRSAKSLAELAQALPGDLPVLVPAVGCGNGQRDLGEVRPILEKHLSSDRFILILEESRRPNG